MTTETGDGDQRRRISRLVFRCVSRFLVEEAARLIAVHDRDFVRAMIFLAVRQATRAGQEARSVSVRAIAQSLMLPYETTRRKILELEERGYVVRVSAQGVAAAPHVLDGPDVREAGRATGQAVIATIAELKALGVDLLANVPAPTHVSVDASRLDLEVGQLVEDFILRVLEAGVEPHGSMLDALVYTAMMIANADPIVRDPEIAWRYSGADTPPPDTVRRPVTIAELSQRLSIPRETMRRRVTRMLELDRCESVRGGYLSSMVYMQSEALLSAGVQINQRFGQLVQNLRQVGFDLDGGEAKPTA